MALLSSPYAFFKTSNMKNITLIILCFLSTLTLSLANPIPPVFEADFLDRKITLTAGTTISLETAEEVFSGKVTIGQMIKFRVVTNVVVDQRVVIITGAIASGRVKQIHEATYNDSESITVEITAVQAVDGQQVALNGTEQTFKGTYPNEGTLVTPGKSISATVMNDMVIKVK